MGMFAGIGALFLALVVGLIAVVSLFVVIKFIRGCLPIMIGLLIILLIGAAILSSAFMLG